MLLPSHDSRPVGIRRVEVEGLNESAGVGGAVLTVHPRVVPVDRQSAIVADVVEGANDARPVDAAVAGERNCQPARGSPLGQYPANTPARPLSVRIASFT